MKQDQSFHDYVMFDLFQNIAGLNSRAMFGGWGIYKNGVIFAIIVDGELYFKVNDQNLQQFKKLGSHPFVYFQAKHKSVTMSYWLLPQQIMEDLELLAEWVEQSVQVSVQSKKKIKKKY